MCTGIQGLSVSSAKSQRGHTEDGQSNIASYQISRPLAKRKKSFKDGELVKEALIETADALFGEFKNKTEIVAAIEDMQLSLNTVTRRCEGMAEDVEAQLRRSHCIVQLSRSRSCPTLHMQNSDKGDK